MGCGGSKVMDDGDPHNDIAKLQLSSKELKAFRKAFNSIDKDNSGSINVKEFIESLGVQRTVVSEEVFEDMDTSNDGTVSFKEFTLLTWRFCTRGLDSIAEFAFDIYDTDNSEQLTKPEIKELIIEAYGKITEKHNVNSLIHSFDQNGDEAISKKEFTKTVRKMPNILQPAMFFQSKLRNTVGDEDFWKKLCDKAERVIDLPEVKALYKTKPRKIHVIKKTKKHTKAKKQKSLDVDDKNHVKVNAHYYEEHHRRNEIQAEKDKQAGKKDMFSLD